MARRYYTWETPEETIQAVAKRFRRVRRRRKVTQKQLAHKSGVSYASLKRFEETGNISLLSLTKLCAALDLGSQITDLFTDVEYLTMEEVIRDKS